jgi:hypothetical protein
MVEPSKKEVKCMWLLIGIIVFFGLAGSLGRRVLRGSKEEQLQELERIKSNSNGPWGGL